MATCDDVHQAQGERCSYGEIVSIDAAADLLVSQLTQAILQQLLTIDLIVFPTEHLLVTGSCEQYRG